jgi:hypothetical protein
MRNNDVGSTVRSDGHIRHLFLCANAIRQDLKFVRNGHGPNALDPSRPAACCLQNYDHRWVSPPGESYVYVISWPVALSCPTLTRESREAGLFKDWSHVGEGGDGQNRLYKHLNGKDEPIRWLPPYKLIAEVVKLGYPSVKVSKAYRGRFFPSGVESVRAQKKIQQIRASRHPLDPGFVTGAETRRPETPDWERWAYEVLPRIASV